MKSLYNTPSIEITEIRSEDIVTISGFNTSDKGGQLVVTSDGKNTINFN